MDGKTACRNADGDPVLFEDDVFKIEIPLEEISGLESADKPPINRLKPATNRKQVCKHNE